MMPLLTLREWCVRFMMWHNHTVYHITVWHDIVKNRTNNWVVFLHPYNDTITLVKLLNLSGIQSKLNTARPQPRFLSMLERVACFLVNGLVTSITVISI